MEDRLFDKLRSAFFSPLVLGSIALMFLNDHFLKQAQLLPGLVTGKISDFTFLFFAPIVLAYFIRANSRLKLFLAFAIPALVFTAINCIPPLSHSLAGMLGVFGPSRLWPDVEDLVALSVLPLSLGFILTRHPAVPVVARPRIRFAEIVLISAVSFTCLATSQLPPTLYEPIYMSWEEFRSAVKVLPPEPIGKRGKIYTKGDYLYVCEPNRGIHILDIRDLAHPEPKAFFRIPGNLDVAIKGSALYADSFTDLLVFCLAQDPADSLLVKRIENVFPYDPGQTLGQDEFLSRSKEVDKKKGVVIAWRQITADRWQGRNQ
jgi:hypothetical protein